MRRLQLVLAFTLCVLASTKADLPPAFPPGLDPATWPGGPPVKPIVKPISKAVGWVAVEWGSGGIGRACDREKMGPGTWVWSRMHDDWTIATVVLQKKNEGTGWWVAAKLTDADGNEWKTQVETWVPGNAKYRGWHTETGLGVDIWVDVGGAPPE